MEDGYGNIVATKGDPIYGITLYGTGRNPTKILDELIKSFDIRFIDDKSIDLYHYETKKYENIDLFTTTMIEYGYLLNFDGKIVIPERVEYDYLPYNEKNSVNYDQEKDSPY